MGSRNQGVTTMGEILESIEDQVELEEMVSDMSDDELVALDEGIVDPEEALEWMLQERQASKARKREAKAKDLGNVPWGWDTRRDGKYEPFGKHHGGGGDLGLAVNREKFQKSVHKGTSTQDLQKNIHSKSKELKHLARKEMAFRAQHGQSGPSKSTKSMCKQGEKMVFGTCRKVGR